MKLQSFGFLLLLSFSANSAPLDFACWWEPHSSTDGSDDTGQFFDSPQSPLRLSIDLDANTVTLSDRTDAIILPHTSMVAISDRVVLNFVQPNMRAIKGQPSLLKVSINRYTLDSWITLALPTGPSKEMQSRWIRRGRCVQKQF